MLIFAPNTIDINGIKVSEKVYVKTRLIPDFSNKTMQFEFQIWTESSIEIKNRVSFALSAKYAEPIPFDSALVESWEKQNQNIKDFFVKEIGISEEAITICEDLDENGEPINII